MQIVCRRKSCETLIMKYYQPKGSMCIACEKLNDDCSKLDFGEMKKIGIYTDNHGKTITMHYI